MFTRRLSASIFVCAFVLIVPATSYACDTAERNSLEREKSSLFALNSDGAQATLYNFRRGQCMPLNEMHSVEPDMSAFLPSDETSLGMYQLYRDRGESRINALKNTLEFMIAEQQD